MIKVLVVEDDANLSFLIKLRLEKLGDYAIECAADGAKGLKALTQFKPDIIVTDLEMASMDGNAMIEEIRRQKNDIPIIVLTGRAELLRASGANAYLTKPFNVQQLHLNLQALLKTAGLGGSGSGGEKYKIGVFTFDTSRRCLNRQGDNGLEETLLTPTAARILEMLCRSKGQCVERERILATVWGGEKNDSLSHNLDVQIDKLRKALKPDPTVRLSILRRTGITLND